MCEAGAGDPEALTQDALLGLLAKTWLAEGAKASLEVIDCLVAFADWLSEAQDLELSFPVVELKNRLIEEAERVHILEQQLLSEEGEEGEPGGVRPFRVEQSEGAESGWVATDGRRRCPLDPSLAFQVGDLLFGCPRKSEGDGPARFLAGTRLLPAMIATILNS